MKTPPPTLSLEWWDKVIVKWNESDYKSSLAKLGVVCFEVTDSNQDPTFIEWDNSGNARRLDYFSGRVPKFSASENSWKSFIRGDFKASIGVIQGKIAYHGPMIRILPYASAFDNLAKAAQSITIS